MFRGEIKKIFCVMMTFSIMALEYLKPAGVKV
jgi:hypothetical protein